MTERERRRREQEHIEHTLLACALRDVEAARRLTPRVHPLMFVSPECARCWSALALVAARECIAAPLLDAVATELAGEGDAPGEAALGELAALVPLQANTNGPYIARRVVDEYRRRVWRRRIPNADRYDWRYNWREADAETHRRRAADAAELARQCAATPSRRDLAPAIRADAERHAAEAERLERDVVTTRARRRLVRRRLRIAARIAAGCGAVLLVLAFAARWHPDLRDVASPVVAGVTGPGVVVGVVLVCGGWQDDNRRFMLGGGLLAAGAVALFVSVLFWW